MDETLIVVSIISTLGGVIIVELLNHNWFRRERFKVDLNFNKKKNDLEFKKLARELGLSTTKAPSEPPEKSTGANLIGAVLPELIKNMDPEQLSSIATNLIGQYGGSGEDYEGGGGGVGDVLGDLIANNPEIVKGFLEGFTNAKAQNKNTEFPGQVP